VTRAGATLLATSLVLSAGPAAGQRPTAPTASVPAVAAALDRARSDHLRRVALWGAANVVLGAGLWASAGSDTPTRRGFGIQTAAWGAINLGIAAWAGLSFSETDPGALSGVLAAEDRWAHILLVNLGLNVGYMAVGGALWAASTRGLRSGRAVRGHAAAVVLQGAGLLVLDGVAWLSSSHRLEVLRGIVESMSVSAGPAAGTLSVGFGLPLG
jgi:hypothetical protein